MRVLEVNNTAIDLNAQTAPFLPNYTVVAINTAAEQRVLQGSVDAAFTSPVTLATLAAAGTAGSVQSVTPTYQYIRTSAASDPVWLLGN
jgi:ABC-type amino acid transport substrate-binding protein